MAKTLDFSELEPERSKFKDSDGIEYEFAMIVDFGAVTQAQYNKANRMIHQSTAKLESDPTDVDSAREFENAMRLMMRVILPGLPAKRIGELKVIQMNSVIRFWMTENGITAPAGGVSKPVIERNAVEGLKASGK